MELSGLEAVCLASSVVLTSVFYNLYRRQRAVVRRIEAAPRLQVGADLRTFMGSSQNLCYAVLEGRVEAIGTPLCSQNHPHLQAAIQKHQMIEHRLFWNSLTRSWSEYVQIIHESVKSVPFQLCPLENNDDSVLVFDPLQATGLTLETVYERFHAASLGLGELIGHYLSGEKPTGILETEAILPVGRVLTGLGLLTLNNDGVITLQPPRDGSKYVLSLTGYDDILYQQECAAYFWRGAAFICGTFGAVVLCISLYRAYRRHKEQHSHEECWDELHMEGEVPDEDTVSSERLCVICISRPRECVILPCGHVCCCFLCYQALPSEICPICRCHIQRIVPLYQA